MVIPNVCWGSCTPCLYPPQPPAGLTCAAGNPGLYLQMILFLLTDGVVILEQEMVFGELILVVHLQVVLVHLLHIVELIIYILNLVLVV